MQFECRQVQYRDRLVSVPINKYQYQKLTSDQDELRLLEILPASNFDDPIQCRLSHYSLDNPPYYTALSYLWGDPSHWTAIEMDGVPFAVGLNLEAAVRQLRSNKCPLIWIDAICINQQDRKEKDRCIPLMKRVYHSADYVSIWLGDQAVGSDAPMGLLKKIQESRRPERVGIDGPYSPNLQLLKQNQTQISALFRRQYWQRVWIIQEIAVGSRVDVLCGSVSTDWRAIEVLLPLLGSDPSLNTPELEVVRYLIARRNLNLDGKQLGLLQILYDTRAAQATDRRDKVFALYGLASDAPHFMRNPSYDGSDLETCLQMTKSAIRAKKSLDIIFAAGHSRQTADLPSWVPDYLHFGATGHAHILQSVSRYISGEDERWRAGNLRRRWNATNGSVPTRSTDIDSRKFLFVHGSRFGTIKGLGYLATDDAQLGTTKTATDKSESKSKIAYKLGPAYSLFSQFYETQRSSPAVTNYLWSFDVPAWYRLSSIKSLKQRFQLLLQWRERNRKFFVQGRYLKDVIHYGKHETALMVEKGAANAGMGYAIGAGAAMFLPPPLNMIAAVPVSLAASYHVTSREPPVNLVDCLEGLQDIIREGMRLMTTTEGDVGWAHPAAQEGDELFLLEGASMPAILRPSEDDSTYKLIGHAYVEGAMNGEIWSRLSEDQLQKVMIS